MLEEQQFSIEAVDAQKIGAFSIKPYEDEDPGAVQ